MPKKVCPPPRNCRVPSALKIPLETVSLHGPRGQHVTFILRSGTRHKRLRRVLSNRPFRSSSPSRNLGRGTRHAASEGKLLLYRYSGCQGLVRSSRSSSTHGHPESGQNSEFLKYAPKVERSCSSHFSTAALSTHGIWHYQNQAPEFHAVNLTQLFSVAAPQGNHPPTSNPQTCCQRAKIGHGRAQAFGCGVLLESLCTWPAACMLAMLATLGCVFYIGRGHQEICFLRRHWGLVHPPCQLNRHVRPQAAQSPSKGAVPGRRNCLNPSTQI